MKRAEIRTATARDLEEFYGHPPERSMRAFAAVLGKKVIAVAGVYRGVNHMVAFSQMKDEMRPRKKDIVRLAHVNMAAIKNRGQKVIAFADQNEMTAPSFLTKLGFKHVEHTADGEAYEYGE